MKKASAFASGAGCALAAALLAGPWASTAVAAPAAGSAQLVRPHATAHPTGATGAPAEINTAAVAKAVEPAVVDVNTVLDPLEGGGATAGAGTGMIVSPDGEIVTNNHVVSGADRITVTVPGHGTHQATFVGSDPTEDIAVIKVTGLSNLPTIRWANSSAVQVGTSVVAIGNALGLGGEPTVTQGIISATGRTITAADQTGANPETLHGLLQTDAPIAPGNSGGPLVNASDQVVGMDTAAASAGSVGASLGFAIPSNRVRTVAGEIAAHEHLAGLVYGRPTFLGVEVVSSSQATSNPFGLGFGSFGFGSFGFGSFGANPFGLGPSTPTKPGVVVEAVDPGSGAANAGLQAGEEITAVDGTAVRTPAALSKVVKSHKPGQELTLTVYTGSAAETIHARLGQGPVD